MIKLVLLALMTLVACSSPLARCAESPMSQFAQGTVGSQIVARCNG